MAWNSGFYTAGEYAGLEPEGKVAFSWRGRDDPGVSQVHVTITPQESGALVHLEHTLPKTGEEWGMTTQEIEAGWRGSLENLASVLGTGEDLRFTRRPMLGINPSDFNAEIAHKLGVPVDSGVRIDNTVEGMGAQAAGLQSDDVIVGLDGKEVTGFASLPAILQRRQAGDIIEVRFYRGAELHSVQMELSRRALPEIPATCAELAERVRASQAKVLADLNAFFQPVSDAEATFKPAPDEWSALEVMAHLLQGERYWQFIIAEMVTGFENWSDDWGGNLGAQVQATVRALPTVADMLTAYQRSCIETVALYECLPAEFEHRKGAFWRLAYAALEAPAHFFAHLDQMKTAIAAARKG
jgi:hypothetical protein